MAKRVSLVVCPLSQLGNKAACLGVFRLFLMAFCHAAQGTKEAFIQSDTILEVLRFGDGGLLQTEAEIGLSSYQKSTSLHQVNCRPIRFEPPMLDFSEQPVGMPKMEKVYLHNPSSDEAIILVSISATTSHFHASFFQNRIIPPGGNTSFDVVFLARVVGNVENTLFINTSHHGVFTYQVFGVGIPNPYRLRPFIGARVPVNSSFSPLINIHNPHSEPLQVVEMYSSGGDLHLELPTGQQGGTVKLWEIPPFETKGVMRASFSSRDADNHTAFIRIKTNMSADEFIILPVEVEVTSAPGIYSSVEMLDFGTLRSQDHPKVLNIHLLNSGTKDVPITSVRPTPSNEAITVDFKPVTLKAGENKYTKVASISFDASKAKKISQLSGKITVKAKEKTYSKLEIPYQADVLEGYLGFDHAATLFHIRDSPTDPVERPIDLTNAFNFAVRIHNVSLPEEAKAMFSVFNFTDPILIPPLQSQYIFSLRFTPARPSIHIDSNILLVTNASKFHLPVRAYTGFLELFIISPNMEEHFLDFRVLSATEQSTIVFIVMNNNPIELAIKSWHVIGDGLTVDLVKSIKGNKTTAMNRIHKLENSSSSEHTTVILGSGYYAVFRATLTAKDLEGPYDGAIQITTDYEILTIPVKAVIAVGSLSSSPKHIVLPPSFPGKVVHQSFNILSSFSQKVKLQNIRPLTEDIRFYCKRLKSNKDELEPKRKSKVGNLYFDPGLRCSDHCYVGLPFLFKSDSKTHGLSMQEDLWETDLDLHVAFYRKWKELKDSGEHQATSIFEVDTDLQRNVQAKVTAEMIWPSIIKTSQQIIFPITSTNSSSEEDVVLENPADLPVFVQIVPLALYPNPLVMVEKLSERCNIGKFPNIDSKTHVFQVHNNQTAPYKNGQGFLEGSSRPYVHNLILSPGEVKSFTLKFSPVHNRTVTSLIIIRNNLTVLDCIVAQGHGAIESLKIAGKPPGPGSSLRFKMTESLLKDCSDKIKSKEPNFTLKRTFKIENTGQLPVSIKSTEVSGYPCEGYGFKVVNCQEFVLKPNSSKDIVIMFTPDFTASRIIRELKLITAGGTEFVFVLNASLPYHMLSACAETLPRPNWELGLYIIISVIMSFMFLLVIGTAYLEALGIWEPFRRRLSFEASNHPLDLGRPFDLRRIVGISPNGNLNEYSDSNHNSTRGMYGSGSSSRSNMGHHRQCNVSQSHTQSRTSVENDGSKSRIISNSISRSSMQTTSTQSANKTNAVATSETCLVQCPINSKRTRPAKQQQSPTQQHPVQNLIEEPSPQTTVPQQHCQETEGLQRFHPAHPEGNTARHSSEDSDYTSLVEAMDKDLDHTDSPPPPPLPPPAADVFLDQPSSPAPPNKVKIQRKSKAQKKKAEKERRNKSKTNEDDLKDSLADNDDSSSTTTETSNPDMETSTKEGPERKKGRTFPFEKEKDVNQIFHLKAKHKKVGNGRKDSQTDVKPSSLELPYTTPLESKQRRNFSSKNIIQQSIPNGSKIRNIPKRGSCGKLEDCRPSNFSKFLLSNSTQEPSNSSSSEGEKDSPPPEWDCVPLHKSSSSADSLYQLSLQTMNADVFLKRPMSSMSRTSSPPPSLFNLTSRGSYSSIVNTNSENAVKKPNANKHKLAKSSSLPGKNGNPTFAAVAAGYDKSPGGNGSLKGLTTKKESSNLHNIPNTSFESDGSDSSGLWSPIGNPSSPSSPLNAFSAFGPSNSFNLTGEVFNRIAYPKSFSQDPQQNWLEFSHVSPSIWDNPSSPSWLSSSGTSTAPTSSVIGSTTSLWSSSNPFSSSIWSTNIDTGLPFSSPPASTALTDLIGNGDNSIAAPLPANTTEIGRTYNPWSMWRPTLGRRSSEPWPNSSNFTTESGN
ncbi:transmembrane protein 131 [Erpetoichthys calabaricus]|uniref:transmembrane protein 131 n=1 Tax=Erpetoichthys calabaricus TaxID=27687 RepID=UPI0022346DEA|nr:transmembrane protein 131 [Erpetoichthys calabaricus]